MFSTIAVFTLFLALLIVPIILWAIFLRLGLRWSHVPNVTNRRVVGVTIGVTATQILLTLLLRLWSPATESQMNFRAILELASTVIVPCLVITRVFQIGILRSLKAWLPTLLPSIGVILFLFFAFRPFIYEAFFSPTNSMAPTLLGNHWRSICPECGQTNYCSSAMRQVVSDEPRLMICNNFHVTKNLHVDQRNFSGDRFLVAKFLSPQRWDLAVFQLPQEPSTLYVMRLVGLPGETIHIENDAVWVNGSKLALPDSLRGLQYVSEFPEDPYLRLWGVKDRPAKLGEGEYFVLGDFSMRSKDSRFWEEGPSEHPPYAVPASHLRGVVTHIYWPPQRWRILR